MDRTSANSMPEKYGLYDPANEKDSCGVGFVANVKGVRSHQIVLDADQVLRNMDHRAPAAARRTPATAPAFSRRFPTN